MQPLFYAALAGALGIATAAAGPPRLGWLGSPLWTMSLGLGALAALAWPRRRALAAVLGLGLCVSAGYGRAAWELRHPAPPSALVRAAARLEPKPRDRVWVTGYLRDSPEPLYTAGRVSAVRLDLEAQSIAASPQTPPEAASGGIRLYAYPPRNTSASSDDSPDTMPAPANDAWAVPLARLAAGDGLAVSGHLRPPPRYRDPGVADFTAAARREDIELTSTLGLDAWRTWPTASQAGRGPALYRARLWHWLSARLDTLAPPRQAPRANALLRGMLLGDVARLDDATRTALQADGVYHLVVVAGLHIGILAALFLFLLRRCGLGPLAAAGISLTLLCGYAWVIVGRTPTERALLMLGLYFATRLWYRERQALNAVGLAALILLAIHPLDLFQAGWQMSLGAATLLAGVALPVLAATSRPLRRATRLWQDVGYDLAFSPRLANFRLDQRELARRLARIWPPLGSMPGVGVRGLLHLYEVVVISLVLQIGFAAFNTVYFHRLNPWSVAANMVLVPAAGLLIPLAWVGVAIGQTAGGLIRSLVQAMLWVAEAMARWPGAAARVPSPPGWALMVFGGLMGCWLAAAGRAGASVFRLRALVAASVGAGLAALAIGTLPFAPRLPPGLSATVLDVGQGDAIFVSFPDGRTLLVDGGPRSPHWDSGAEIVEPFLWSLGLRRLDAVLLTHGHLDHLGGLPAVVGDFRPAEIWMTRTLPSEPSVLAFVAQARASGARLRRVSAGDAFQAGASRLEVLLPPASYQAGELASNDDSLVLRLQTGGAAMLLEGDAEAGGEAWLVRHGVDMRSALLKVGHHGSRTSSTMPFLEAVQPQVAVISDGAGNAYGHPAPEVVARLEAAGARVFRTDRDGALQCRLYPGRLEVYVFAPSAGTGGG